MILVIYKNDFSEYEIDPPSKDHACQLMNNISSEDIVELRQVFKKYNKNYENIISPLVIIMGLKVNQIYLGSKYNRT